uniref:RNA guanine 9 methyltransferase n=2 Tax=Echinococcus granulosus TaxID=6210 RepID=A0A068WDG8_ECHGR|nr:RNA guanine 9 methyltransferase [Echinococcus granulosus]
MICLLFATFVLMSTEDRLFSNLRTKRRLERLRRRKRDTESIRRHLEAGGEYISKRERIRLSKERLRQNLVSGVKFCIDCSFEGDMSAKEHSKFAQQLCRVYGANKKAVSPLSLHLVNFNPAGLLAECCRRKCCGFDNYQIGFHVGSPTDVFKSQRIVYLSPDASDPLLDVDKCSVYVAGGLIDENIVKGRSLDTASRLGISAVRLPIQEFAPRDWSPQNPAKSSSLPLNIVVEILLAYLQHRDWRTALDHHLPHRFRTPSILAS